MKARALFSAGLLCAKQGKPEVQWKGRTGDRQVTAAYRIFRRNVCYDVPFWVLSGFWWQHTVLHSQFCLWDLSDGTGSLTHQTHMPEESPFQKMVCFSALLACPWHYCQRPGPWAEAVPCSPGMPAADSAFQPFWQQHFPPHQEKKQGRRSCLTVELGRLRIFQFLSDSLLKKCSIWIALQLGYAWIQLSIPHFIQWMLSVKYSKWGRDHAISNKNPVNI